MKVLEFAIIFLLVLEMQFIPMKIDLEKKIQANQYTNQYNDIVADASNDAAKALIETSYVNSDDAETLAEGKREDYRTSGLNLDKALFKFYQTMYLNLNLNSKVSQNQLKMYVPIAIAIGYDGYYINTFENKGNKINQVWKQKKKWVYFDKKENIEINFTLSDVVTIVDFNTKKTMQGKAKDLAITYPNSILSNKNFDFIRKKKITDTINQDLAWFTSKNNKIAKKNGWKYTYSIPYVGTKEITDNIGFIAFVQGLAIKGMENKFNSYGFGTAKIVNSTKYYGYIENGKKYYYRAGDEETIGNPVIFNNKIDAAKAGYYPSPKSNP